MRPTHTRVRGGLGAPQTPLPRALPMLSPTLTSDVPNCAFAMGTELGQTPCSPAPRGGQQPGTSANSPFNPGPKTPLPCKSLHEGGWRAEIGEQP